MASWFRCFCFLLSISASLQYVIAQPVGAPGRVNSRSSGGMTAHQDGMTNVNSNTKTEKINVGTRKTNNYNFAPSHFKPTQTTNVILNVPPHFSEPATPKSNRQTRPPTEEEVEIKERILELYEKAINEKDNELYKVHLGKVLEALNPKYIATQRVRRVVFSDPEQFSDLQKVNSGNEVAGDETVAESDPVPSAEDLQNEINDKVKAQLNDLIQRFAQEIQFTPEFLDNLSLAEESQMTPHQLVFKHMIVCVTNPAECTLEMLSNGQQQRQVGEISLPIASVRTQEPPMPRAHQVPQLERQPPVSPRLVNNNFNSHQQARSGLSQLPLGMTKQAKRTSTILPGFLNALEQSA